MTSIKVSTPIWGQVTNGCLDLSSMKWNLHCERCSLAGASFDFRHAAPVRAQTAFGCLDFSSRALRKSVCPCPGYMLCFSETRRDEASWQQKQDLEYLEPGSGLILRRFGVSVVVI